MGHINYAKNGQNLSLGITQHSRSIRIKQFWYDSLKLEYALSKNVKLCLSTFANSIKLVDLQWVHLHEGRQKSIATKSN